MEQLNQYDVAEVQSCAEAALLTDNPVVRTYLSLLITLEGEANHDLESTRRLT